MKNAKNHIELDDAVNREAIKRNIELDNSMPYSEQADFLVQEAPKSGNGESGMMEMADILYQADKKWFELDAQHNTGELKS